MATQEEQRQQQLRAAYEARQNQIEVSAKRILAERGEALQRQAAILDMGVIPDSELHKLAAGEMAHMIAQRGVTSGNFDMRDHRDLFDKAMERAEAALEAREQGGEPTPPEAAAPSGPPMQQPDAAPERQPARTYADLKREHAEIVANGREHGQGEREPGRKTLGFYEDRESARERGAEKDGAREEAPEQEAGERKSLSFFEERNPAQDRGIEH